MSDVFPSHVSPSGISGLVTFLSPVLFLYLVLLFFLPSSFLIMAHSAADFFGTKFPDIFCLERPFCMALVEHQVHGRWYVQLTAT